MYPNQRLGSNKMLRIRRPRTTGFKAVDRLHGCMEISDAVSVLIDRVAHPTPTKKNDLTVTLISVFIKD